MKRSPETSQGMTLVLALFIIVLISVLVVGLLSQAQNMNAQAQLHSEALRGRQLADSAMNLVVSRIQDATQTQAGQTWASQPGAIRIYDLNGNLANIFKLYTSTTGTTTVASELAADLPPTDWANQSNSWVDLNAPISRSGKLTFPVADPRLYTATPGVDPEGFSYTNTVAGTVMPSGGPSDTQRLPMPVLWLYVLSDGSFVAPVSTGSGAVSIAGAGQAAPNGSKVEVVGRVAFWTDDESSKINVNTAAGGVFWDTPRINSPFEQNLALSQPVQGEYQRYPGHPATVDLRAVFPGLSLDALYQLAPKVQTGGSKGGTVETSANTRPLPIVPDSDRLYASTDEARYKPDRTEFAADNSFGATFTDQMKRGGFLLTTASRAPELNLFGRPRIAVWPIASNPDDRSALDKLIAFCATSRVGGVTPRPYYFLRQDASSTTYDYTQIPNNQDLLNYLQTATSQPVPGFGGDFKSKYTGPVRDQILTEIFDYIRGATNLKDPLGKKYADPDPSTVLEAGEGQVAPIRIDAWGTDTKPPRGFGRFLTVSEAFFWFTWQGQGKNTSTSPPTASDPAVAPAFPIPVDPPPDDTVQIQAVFALQFCGAAAGYSEFAPDITVKIEHLDQFNLSGTNMGFPGSGTVTLDQIKDVPTGAIEDFRCMVRNKIFDPAKAGSNRFPFYSNIIAIPRTGAVSMTGDGTPVVISIYAGSSASDSKKLIQTINLQIPTASITAPLKPSTAAASDTQTPRWWGSGTSPDRFYWATKRIRGSAYMNQNDRTRSMVSATGDHRLTAAIADVPSSFFIPHQGSAGTSANAWTSNAAHVSSLQDPLSYNGYGPVNITTGKLISGLTYSSGVARPPVATHVLGKPNGATAWDWDTGAGARADGPWINKPDEGSLGSSTKDSYFGAAETGQGALDQTMFLPNRQISSPGMFGSLPTGINPANPAQSIPWQTLLLRPDPADHPGNASPRDHLLLDLFWMPVVEPYAISEPFSTAGKVNMNSRLVPFTNITRETALYAALEDERILSLQPGDINTAKYYSTPNSSVSRSALDVNETLNGFRKRFDSGGIFLSPTEISTIYLVPKGQTYAGAPLFWQNASATGDNVREKPYANLLAKLTTKSNTYAVHVVAQSLRKGRSSGSDPALFGQTSDRVTAEWKGTFLIERFLDPNDPRLPDFASTAALSDWSNSKYNGDTYYQTRIIQVKEWR